jgi:hypothetical protein
MNVKMLRAHHPYSQIRRAKKEFSSGVVEGLNNKVKVGKCIRHLERFTA